MLLIITNKRFHYFRCIKPENICAMNKPCFHCLQSKYLHICKCYYSVCFYHLQKLHANLHQRVYSQQKHFLSAMGFKKTLISLRRVGVIQVLHAFKREIVKNKEKKCNVIQFTK